uniref:Core Histone H2A/H2B/H3 domain-containing protein n=1 Tax=Chara braunii TaxID=69332 RepID=A0A388KP34_CHABU
MVKGLTRQVTEIVNMVKGLTRQVTEIVTATGVTAYRDKPGGPYSLRWDRRNNDPWRSIEDRNPQTLIDYRTRGRERDDELWRRRDDEIDRDHRDRELFVRARRLDDYPRSPRYEADRGRGDSRDRWERDGGYERSDRDGYRDDRYERPGRDGYRGSRYERGDRDWERQDGSRGRFERGGDVREQRDVTRGWYNRGDRRDESRGRYDSGDRRCDSRGQYEQGGSGGDRRNDSRGRNERGGYDVSSEPYPKSPDPKAARNSISRGADDRASTPRNSCRGEDHIKRDCPDLKRAIEEGLVVLDDRKYVKWADDQGDVSMFPSMKENVEARRIKTGKGMEPVRSQSIKIILEGDIAITPIRVAATKSARGSTSKKTDTDYVMTEMDGQRVDGEEVILSPRKRGVKKFLMKSSLDEIDTVEPLRRALRQPMQCSILEYLAASKPTRSTQPGKRREKRSEISRLSDEVEGPCGPGRVGGWSAAQGDMAGPSDVAMSQSPGKMKKCMSGPPRGQMPAGRKKVNPKAVPATGDTAGARTQVPRRRRYPGMATLSEIRKSQRSTDLCLAFRPFLRLVREVVEEDIAPGMDLRFQMTAVRALMEAAEAYVVANFENTNEVAIHSKRVTIQVRDMRLVDRLSKPRWVEKYQEILPHVHVDNDVEDSAYSLKGVVLWMRSEGMCEEGDVHMTMQQKVRTYRPADFKKLLTTVAWNGGMLVDGSKDELESGAAEILVLSRMKNITQTPPEDFQDVFVIVADGVKYILLDQLVDFIKKSVDDRNVIHEALHKVIEFAQQGQDLIEFVPARTEDNIISGRLLWGELLSTALERLGLASCDVERQREREEGWKVMFRKTNLAIIPNNGQTSAAQESITSMAVDVSPMQTTTREELVYFDIFNDFTMEKEQCDRGFEEVDLPSCCAEYTDSAEEEDEEEDEGASSSDVEVRNNDVSSDEEDEEHYVYYDLKGAGGQVTKGWVHAILRLARAFPDPHKLLRVVMKWAIPDDARQYAAMTSIMKS